MDLNLERSDLLQLDAISNRRTLKLLPIGKKGKQKLVVGDDSGTVSCYEFKKGEPQEVFTAKLFDMPITNVCVGGIHVKQDKIFVAAGQKIIGITKKGKEFFKLSSSVAETINNVEVDDALLWTGCEFVHNKYHNGNDKEFYMCKDAINGMIVDNISREFDWDVVFACQDNCIRIIDGSQLIMEIPIEYGVTEIMVNTRYGEAMSSAQNTSIKSNNGSVYLFYATENGCLGMIKLTRVVSNSTTAASSLQYTFCWLLEDWGNNAGSGSNSGYSKNRSTRLSGITCLALGELSKKDVNNIIVGRDDGRVDIYEQDPAQDVFSPPRLVFSRDIGESVRSVVCGLVNTVDFPEVIVAGYSGKIISFTTEQTQRRAAEDKHGRSIQTINDENRIKHLKSEIEQLKTKVEKEKEKLKKLPSSVSESVATSVQDFPVNYKFLLDSSMSVYVLNIELQVPIDLIMLRSPVLLDLMEAEVGSSTVSVVNQHNASDTSDQAKFFACFRCQGNEKRLRLNLRFVEGEHGEVSITIVGIIAGGLSLPAGGKSGPAQIVKAAKIITLSMKPLSLHMKVSNLKEEEILRPRHVLKFYGSTLNSNLIFAWVQTIFPDVPQKLVDEADPQSTEYLLNYRNVFTQSIVLIKFKNRELVFECESASAVCIIKENITKLASYHRTHIDESLELSASANISFLTLLRPRLSYWLSLAKSVQILEGIQEILVQEDSEQGDSMEITAERFPWLSPDLMEIAQNQKSIKRDFQQRSKSLEYLSGIVTDLYADFSKLKHGGVDGEDKLAEVRRVLYSGDIDHLLEKFRTIR